VLEAQRVQVRAELGGLLGQCLRDLRVFFAGLGLGLTGSSRLPRRSGLGLGSSLWLLAGGGELGIVGPLALPKNKRHP